MQGSRIGRSTESWQWRLGTGREWRAAIRGSVSRLGYRVPGRDQLGSDEPGRWRLLGFFGEWVPKEAAEAGAAIGVEHAESFRVLDLS
jgi:hypothetical protein